MKPFRLRQLVIACKSQDSYSDIQEILDLGQPFHDPGVSEFGLHNAVFALGDQFLEIVVPINDKAPAKRFIDRSGEGGYMAIFQTDNLAAARQRIVDQDIRSVWNIDLKDIAATHLHPADVGGAIVSIDQAFPPESWRWGGKDWQSRSAPGRLIGARLSSPDPERLAARWAAALGLQIEMEGAVFDLTWDEGRLEFSEGKNEKLQQFDLAIADPESAFAKVRHQDIPVHDDKIIFAGISLKLEQLRD